MSSSFQGTYLLLWPTLIPSIPFFFLPLRVFGNVRLVAACVLITTLVFIVCSGVWSGCAEPSNETLSGI